MKRISISLLFGVLLLFGVWIGVSTAEGSSPEKIEFAGSVNAEKALNPATDTYTYFVYFPAIFQQYTVPTWQQFGLQGIQIKSIAVSPDGTLYAGTRGQGLYHSTDSGISWQQLSVGIPTNVNVLATEIDAFNPQRVYASSSLIYPHFFISPDSGATWTPAGAFSYLPHVLVSDPLSAGRLFAGDLPLDWGGGRVYRSKDHGLSWTIVITEQILPVNIAVSPVHSGTVYVGAAKGLYKSTDGGDSWQRLTNDLPEGVMADVVVHPIDELTIYVSKDTGIYKTTDGGDTWNLWGKAHPPSKLYEWIIDLRNPMRHYAIFAYYGVYFSSDEGQHWQAINTGLSSAIAHTLSLNSESTQLYAGTTNGVYVLDLSGGQK